MPCSASSARADGGLVDALGRRTASSGCSCSPSGARRSQPSTPSARAQPLVRVGVALPARLEPLLVDDPQRLAQRVDHVDRRGVVVGARRRRRASPSSRARATGRSTTSAPGVDARAELRDRALAGGERRQPRRAVQALLRPAERGVDAGLVEEQRLAAQRRHAVDEQQRVALAARVGRARRAAGRRRSTSRRARRPSRRAPSRAAAMSALEVDRAAPLGLDAHDLGAGARRARRPSARRTGRARRTRRGRRARRSSRPSRPSRRCRCRDRQRRARSRCRTPRAAASPSPR